MDSAAIEQAAEYLCRSRLQQRLIGPLPLSATIDEDGAYAIQAALHAKLSGALGARVGHKIGCTTPVMQAFLNIAQPCAGGIFEQTVQRHCGRFAPLAQGRLGVECEIAVQLGADLPASGARYDPASVAPAVSACMAAIELVADRYEDYSSLGAPTLIADDFFNVGCVLGEPVTDWQTLELAALSGCLWVNGELRGQGRGADILGQPLAALAWLANHRAALNRPLQAGEFVLLGSVVQTQWLAPGDRARIAIDGLGEATLVIEKTF